MRTVEVNSREFETIPGYTTSIDVATWKGKIDTLLYKLSANPKVKVKKKAWLTEEDQELLLLELEVTVGNVQRRIQFRIEPTLIIRKVNDHGKIRLVKEERASWKLLFELLDKKLAAARLGIVEIHHEFMPYISKVLPDGREGTLADVMDIVAQADRLSEFGALTDQSKEANGSKRIDADYKVKE